MLELNIKNFGDEVTGYDGFALVEFWGEECEPCKKLMPVFEDLENKLSQNIKMCKLNITQNRKLAISQRVMTLPTVVLYKNGERIDKAHGPDASEAGIITMLERNLTI